MILPVGKMTPSSDSPTGVATGSGVSVAVAWGVSVSVDVGDGVMLAKATLASDVGVGEGEDLQPEKYQALTRPSRTTAAAPPPISSFGPIRRGCEIVAIDPPAFEVPKWCRNAGSNLSVTLSAVVLPHIYPLGSDKAQRDCRKIISLSQYRIDAFIQSLCTGNFSTHPTRCLGIR